MALLLIVIVLLYFYMSQSIEHKSKQSHQFCGGFAFHVLPVTKKTIQYISTKPPK